LAFGVGRCVVLLPMEIRLDGRVALITGGSKGIGKAIAAGFAASGAHVVISSRKPEGLAAAAEELNAAAPAGSGSVSWFAANAGDPAQAAACMAEVMARHGRVDILVNNAAVNPYYGPILGIDAVRAEKTVAVNQFGYLVWTKLAWDAWMQANGGVVLNLSSVGGLNVEEGIGYYNVTKAAVLHMTRQMAAEMAPGVRVNAIAPGLVKTDFAKALWEANEAKLAARTPLHRLGEPADIANAAVFLCSDAASWITGTYLLIDGGSMTGTSLS
jgi:NAD(P)-dependent dehydrogenase (short-subunit alcohol dehydrogenase family)